MSSLSISRVISGIVAVIVLSAGFLINGSRHGQPVLDAAATLPASLKQGEFGNRMREMYSLAAMNFIGKDWAKSEHARLMTGIGKSEMKNFSVIRGKDDRLYRGTLLPIYTSNAERLAKCIAFFAEKAEEEGTKTFYLAAPERVSKESVELYQNMPVANLHPAIDSLLYVLKSRDIPYLDSRYAFWANGVPGKDVTTATGPLLTGGGAFELFSYLLDGLEQKTTVALDPDRYFRNPENYSFTSYPQLFMGSYGKETGPAFSGFDDFVAIAPAFETGLAIEGLDMFGAAVTAEGSAEETLLAPQRLTRVEDFYDFYPQNYYRHSNLTSSVIRNLRNPGGKKILFVHDFYTAQLAGFLAYASGELHTLALMDNQQHNAEEYIKGQDFDCVVISFLPANILEYWVPGLILKEVPEEIDDEEEAVQQDDEFDFNGM